MSHETESLAQLEQRLEKGWQMIDAQSGNAIVRGKLEDHWLKLLATYERRCDQARRYANGEHDA